MQEKKGIFEGRSRRNSYPFGSLVLCMDPMLRCPYGACMGLYTPLWQLDSLHPLSLWLYLKMKSANW